MRLSTCTSPFRLNTKFESAELALKPLAPTVSFGAALAAATAASWSRNPDLLIQILVLLFDRVRRGLLVRLALLFKRLHFLAQLADLLLQGFNVRITVSVRAVCGE